MPFKDYVDDVYELVKHLPRSESYNLNSQMTRAATSVVLNIAEGSTGQTDAEQARFLGIAIRSLDETVACQHLISRRAYLADAQPLRELYRKSEVLVRKLQAMRNALAPDKPWLRESVAEYAVGDDNEPPF